MANKKRKRKANKPKKPTLLEAAKVIAELMAAAAALIAALKQK